MTIQSDDSGQRFFLGDDLQDVNLSPLGSGSVAVFTTRSPDKENDKRNEDSAGLFALDDGSAVIVVADGCGGMPLGGEAADLTIRAFEKTLAEITDPETLRPSILNALESASSAIKDLGVGAASTIVVAEIRDQTVRTYHVGDSELLVVGNRGKLRFQTISHSPVGYAVESGMLDEKGGMLHEDRNIVSNLLGLEDMHIDVGPKIDMRQRDTLVLGSDGVFDNLRQAEVVEIIRKGPLREAARGLKTACLQRMSSNGESTPCKPDDLTFAIFRLGQPTV
jgi:serine/threonine protein phosphatase PrpC